MCVCVDNNHNVIRLNKLGKIMMRLYINLINSNIILELF
jgi:hypothetical protein